MTTTDAFHDGDQVLPEINLWHKRLKKVMRKSDSISPAILDLVEDKMLKKDPNDRLTSNKLCDELDAIVAEAESHLSSEDTKSSRENAIPDNSVKQRLLSAEQDCTMKKSGERELESRCYGQIGTCTTGGHPGQTILLASPVPIGLELDQSNKARNTESPPASTSYRRGNLEQDSSSTDNNSQVYKPVVSQQYSSSQQPYNIQPGEPSTSQVIPSRNALQQSLSRSPPPVSSPISPSIPIQPKYRMLN